MTFSRKMYKWPQEHENVFNITNKQKNANQTIMIHHVTSVRRAIVKKMRGKCRQRSREEGTLVHCWWKCKLVQPLWKTVSNILKNLKTELSYDLAIPFLSICPKEINTGSWKDICTPRLTETLFTVANTEKQPKCPSIDEWIKKIWCVCVCVCVFYCIPTEYYLAMKDENPAVRDMLDPESWRHFAKWNKPEKDQYYMLSFIWGI